MTLRVLLADDQPRVRFALCTLLRRQPELQIVGEVGDVDGLWNEIEAVRPDLLLLDWELGPTGMTDAVLTLRERHPGLFVIALSGRHEARRAALKAGVDAFVSKTDPPERLLDAVQSCLESPRTASGTPRDGQAA